MDTGSNYSGSQINRRKLNFSETEKELLLRLVDEHRDVVENKSNDTNSVQNKEQAWNTITMQYNSYPFVQTDRTPDQLKKLLQNLKTRARKEAKDRGDVVDPAPGGCLDEAISMMKKVQSSLGIKSTPTMPMEMPIIQGTVSLGSIVTGLELPAGSVFICFHVNQLGVKGHLHLRWIVSLCIING